MECDRRDLRGDPARCENARVNRYPTWQIAGNRVEGVMSLDDLARASGYTGDTSTKR